MSTSPSHPRPDVPPLATASPRSQPDTLGRGIFLRKQVRGGRSEAANSLSPGCHSSWHETRWDTLPSSILTARSNALAIPRRGYARVDPSEGWNWGAATRSRPQTAVPQSAQSKDGVLDSWVRVPTTALTSCVIYPSCCLALCLSLPFWKIGGLNETIFRSPSTLRFCG